MRRFGPGSIAAISVGLSAASGVVTNLATERWSWTLSVTLAALVLCSATLAWWGNRAGPVPRTQAVQTASGGRITNSRIEASCAATAEQTATNKATIRDSTISAKEADARQQADQGGSLSGGHIVADQ